MRSTHNAFQGVIMTSFSGKCPYFWLCLLFTWQDLQDSTCLRMVVRIRFQYIIDLIISSRREYPRCWRFMVVPFHCRCGARVGGTLDYIPNPTLRLIQRRVFTLTSAFLSSTNVGIVCDPAALIEQIDDGQNGQRDRCSLWASALLRYGGLPLPLMNAPT